MPTKTKRDEEKWQKAKEQAAKQGRKGDYAYIMGIYKNMKPDYEFKNKEADAALAGRVASRFVTAGRAFRVHVTGMTKGLRDAHMHVSDALNLINYRLHGEGSRDPFTNEPSLSDADKRKANEVAKKLKDVSKALDEAADVIHKNERDIEGLDDFMNFI